MASIEPEASPYYVSISHARLHLHIIVTHAAKSQPRASGTRDSSSSSFFLFLPLNATHNKGINMSVLLETTVGDIVIDLLTDHAPKLCEKYVIIPSLRCFKLLTSP